MVIYSTTNDKLVLGEMRKWDFVKYRQKGILCIEGDRKTPPVAWRWNTRLKPTLQTPIFSVSAPLPVDFSELELFYLIFVALLYWLEGVAFGNYTML